MTGLSRQSRILGGLWGAIIGDALGVPVEFMSREQVRRNPITEMRGYGTFNLRSGNILMPLRCPSKKSLCRSTGKIYLTLIRRTLDKSFITTTYFLPFC
jgi:hypothetical protein